MIPPSSNRHSQTHRSRHMLRIVNDDEILQEVTAWLNGHGWDLHPFEQGADSRGNSVWVVDAAPRNRTSGAGPSGSDTTPGNAAVALRTEVESLLSSSNPHEMDCTGRLAEPYQGQMSCSPEERCTRVLGHPEPVGSCPRPLLD